MSFAGWAGNENAGIRDKWRNNHMHQLSKTFLACLKSDFLSEITEFVRCDHDLNFEIRDSYINIYYKGNSLLKLVESGSKTRYKAEIHKKFLDGVITSLEFSESTVPQFVKNIPLIKENIIKHGKRSLELEYEQMLIRANNYEHRNNTEYFIVDRQYSIREGRFDLTGMYWKTEGRRGNQEVPVCLMELKFALNTDIRDVHNQLARYYEPIKNNAAVIAEELETVFRQKLELKLYDQPTERLKAMETLTFSRNIDKFQFILVLVDYNQNSSLLDLESIRKLPFAKQIKVFHTGFGMWRHNVNPILCDL
jgi:hypothetical protein